MTYSNLAGNLTAQGRYLEAQPFHERALAIQCKALGENHPSTAIACNNVAFNLNAQGRYGERNRSTSGAGDLRKVLGENHPHIAMSYNNLASNLSSARPLWRGAAALRAGTGDLAQGVGRGSP